MRHVVLDPPPAVPIAVVVADPTGATGGLYVERALSVAGDGREFAVDVRDGRALSAWTAAELVATVRRCSCSARARSIARGRELVKNYLARGGQVLLTLGPDVDPGTLADVLGVDLGVSPSAGARRRARRWSRATAVIPSFARFSNPSGALGRRPSGAAPASKGSGRPHGAGAVLGRRRRR